MNRTEGVNYKTRLAKKIRSHRRIYEMALNFDERYQNIKLKREFHSRIGQINANEYLDLSKKPNVNVILIVVDALGDSHLSSQGYFRKTTPFLDSFQSRFSAISASPWTYPSVVSILTGLYPHNHNAHLTGQIKDCTKLENYVKLRGGILTLPEMLFFLGYRIYFSTAIYMAHYSVRTRVIPKRYTPLTNADRLLSDLKKWISKAGGKTFFAYIQLADLHTPLNPPDDFRHFFGDVKDLPAIDLWNFMKPERQRSTNARFQEYKENRQLIYDNIVRYVDSAIERFYNGLRDMGLADSTIFIVTADHGEQFWEHAELDAKNFYLPNGVCGIGHGDNVYNEVVQVPLILSGPVPVRRGTGYVSTVDIVPTLIDLLGISHKMRFDGRNIFEAGEERPLLSEAVMSGYEKKALVIGKYKLIYSKDDGIEWVFDLERDPQEQHPIVDKEVTSVFVEKLHHILREDEKRKIKEIARKKGR